MAMNELRRRRNSKAAYVRHGKSLDELIELKRPASEVKVVMDKVMESYEETVKCHENLMLLTDCDTEFDEAEKWIDDCRRDVLKMGIKAKDYMEPKVVDNSKPASGNVQDQLGQPTDAKCAFKLERPKLPKFDGDVRTYITFRSDFQHAVESRYSQRDSIALLRTCLLGKPLDIITGVGNDYVAAWTYLDAIYGDPRFIADTITNDISKFEPLRENEDLRFCDLVHLVRRSYNSLNEVKRPYDMDNNHMIALIEQKMCIADRKEWARELERSQKPAKLEDLMTWMTREMKSRIRATAAIRESYQNDELYGETNVNCIRTEEAKETPWWTRPYRCWVCQSNSHWVDQCLQFNGKTVDERIKMATDNYACYSCLKKAGTGHRMDTCTRRRQCTEINSGTRCMMYHHPLLHVNSQRPTPPVGATPDIGKGNALLPTIACEIYTNHEQRHVVNVLLDSGSQVSLIRESVAEQLNLPWTSRMVTLSALGMNEEKRNARVYEVKLQSMENNKVYVINAVGIPEINEDNTVFNRDYISRELGISTDKLYRRSGAIDILIGIDYSYMHNGPTTERGGLVARHTPLGWTVFGMLPRQAVRYDGYVSVLTVSGEEEEASTPAVVSVQTAAVHNLSNTKICQKSTGMQKNTTEVTNTSKASVHNKLLLKKGKPVKAVIRNSVLQKMSVQPASIDVCNSINLDKSVSPRKQSANSKLVPKSIEFRHNISHCSIWVVIAVSLILLFCTQLVSCTYAAYTINTDKSEKCMVKFTGYNSHYELDSAMINEYLCAGFTNDTVHIMELVSVITQSNDKLIDIVADLGVLKFLGGGECFADECVFCAVIFMLSD